VHRVVLQGVRRKKRIADVLGSIGVVIFKVIN
jgi:hypothetical protein